MNEVATQSRFKVLTINNIAVAGLERLSPDTFDVGPQVQSADALLLRSADLHSMEIAPSVRAIGRAGAGVNNIPIEEMSRRGVAVFNAPGANANAVKELVIAGLLLAARNICPAWDFARGVKGDDESIHQVVEAGKKRFVGFELPGRTLGVIGLGAIGVLVANAARGLGMNVVGFDPGMTVSRAWQLSADVVEAGSLDEVLRRADMVTVHVPFGPKTTGLIDHVSIASMRDNVTLLNFARGGIVDEQAVVAALAAGKMHAYVCDFPSEVLFGLERVITLPHIGASTHEAQENCAVMVADQVRAFLEDGTVRNSVNFPASKMRRNGGYRVAVVNRNVPNMLGQISTRLADAQLNILDMLNKSRGELAYTLIDVNQPVEGAVLETLAAIEGVLSVRAL
ncbi:MAG: D-3-phosphoglycerate dehydrogenase [Gammaproteobacteria bacterium]|jgi:D-3-phosphoglycerate dehydrogenase